MFRKKRFRIACYAGYGTPKRLRASGRALRDKGIDFAENMGTWKTLRNVYKQLESDELPNTTVRLHLARGISFTTTTDAEGYFHFDEPLESDFPIDSNGLQYRLVFEDQKFNSAANEQGFNGKMFIPSSQTTFGIISDIDDTILHTGVASLFKWKLIINTFFKNFDQRQPVAGMATFYEKLHRGAETTKLNPLFYISNSPWNLYEYLKTFLRRNHFPEGPILLRDFRTPFDKTPKPKLPHKESEIRNVLNLYPELKFILIGDTGEKDADIYMAIAKAYPGRILAIYLQCVPYKRREQRIRKLIADFTTVPILLVKDTSEAERHARQMGYIS